MIGSSKFKPLPEAEKQIGQRLAAIRKFEHLTQARLAEIIGSTQDQIGNVEMGRVPLRAGAACSVCSILKANPLWLVSGNGVPKFTGETIGSWVRDCPRPEMLFSEYFKEFLSGPFAAFRQNQREVGVLLRRFSYALIEASESKGVEKIWEDKELASKFIQDINSLASAFREGEELKNAVRERIEESEDVLDIPLAESDKGGVQKKFHTFGELLDHLRKITKPRGAKAELAGRFKVSRQAVDQWLRGEAKPSAEICIELQWWKPKLEK